MKKTKTILLFILTTFLISCSDNENDISPPIEGDVHLKNQQEVNEFGANNYSGINGNLTIGYQSGVRDITNLNPLSSLSFIDGNLDINYNTEKKKIYINECIRQVRFLSQKNKGTNIEIISTVGKNIYNELSE